MAVLLQILPKGPENTVFYQLPDSQQRIQQAVARTDFKDSLRQNPVLPPAGRPSDLPFQWPEAP